MIIAVSVFSTFISIIMNKDFDFYYVDVFSVILSSCSKLLIKPKTNKNMTIANKNDKKIRGDLYIKNKPNNAYIFLFRKRIYFFNYMCIHVVSILEISIGITTKLQCSKKRSY